MNSRTSLIFSITVFLFLSLCFSPVFGISIYTDDNLTQSQIDDDESLELFNGSFVTQSFTRYEKKSSVEYNLYFEGMAPQSYDKSDNNCGGVLLDVMYRESDAGEQRVVFAISEPADILDLIAFGVKVKSATAKIYVTNHWDNTDNTILHSDDVDVYVTYTRDDSSCDECMNWTDAFVSTRQCRLQDGAALKLDDYDTDDNKFIIFDVTEEFKFALRERNPFYVWLKHDDSVETEVETRIFSRGSYDPTIQSHIQVILELPECTSGDCCDLSTFKYRPVTEVCNTNVNPAGLCSWGSSLGSDVGYLKTYQYCSGSSSSCNGRIENKGYEVRFYCSNSQYCSVGKCCEPHVQSICSNGNAYWKNSCGTVESLKEVCLFGCSAGECLPQCTVSSQCKTGYVCQQNTCVSPSPYNTTVKLQNSTIYSGSGFFNFSENVKISFEDELQRQVLNCFYDSKEYCDITLKSSFFGDGLLQISNVFIEYGIYSFECNDNWDNDWDGYHDMLDSNCDSIYDDSEMGVMQTLNLSPGKNLVTIYVDSQDSDVDKIFFQMNPQISDYFDIVNIQKIEDGRLLNWAPDLPQQFITLSTITPGAYLITTDETAILPIQGKTVESCAVQIQKGTNTVPFYGNEKVPLANIDRRLSHFMTARGGIYYNVTDALIPNEAYVVESNETFIWEVQNNVCEK